MMADMGWSGSDDTGQEIEFQATASAVKGGIWWDLR